MAIYPIKFIPVVIGLESMLLSVCIKIWDFILALSALSSTTAHTCIKFIKSWLLKISTSNLQVSPHRDMKSWRAFESCHLHTQEKGMGFSHQNLNNSASWIYICVLMVTEIARKVKALLNENEWRTSCENDTYSRYFERSRVTYLVRSNDYH